MRKLGIEEVYALAGTFSSDGDNLILDLRRMFAKGDLPITLVYRFDHGGTRRGLDTPEATAKAVAKGYAEDRKKAEAQGWKVQGIQLDLDAPTRRLPEYARLLAALRPEINEPLSITGLATWLRGEIRPVLNQVDFWCPQMYEAEVPKTLADLENKPLSMDERIGDLRPKLQALDVPYRLGIASHGQALLYGPNGLIGMDRSLSPSQAALRFPTVELRGPRDEELLAFQAKVAGQENTIVYRRPEPEHVRSVIATERQQTAALDRGYVLFRLPAPSEELTPTLATVANESPVNVGVSSRIENSSDPFSAIEAGGAVQKGLVYSFKAASALTTALSDYALKVEITFPAGTLTQFSPGDLVGVEITSGGMRSSQARADRITGTLPRLFHDQALTIGPISLAHGQPKLVLANRRGEWTSTLGASK